MRHGVHAKQPHTLEGASKAEQEREPIYTVPTPFPDIPPPVKGAQGDTDKFKKEKGCNAYTFKVALKADPGGKIRGRRRIQ